jgi:hypothetical protein
MESDDDEAAGGGRCRVLAGRDEDHDRRDSGGDDGILGEAIAAAGTDEAPPDGLALRGTRTRPLSATSSP